VKKNVDEIYNSIDKDVTGMANDNAKLRNIYEKCKKRLKKCEKDVGGIIIMKQDEKENELENCKK
jgi:uncharacterized protein YaaN involved in tellurite resistance